MIPLRWFLDFRLGFFALMLSLLAFLSGCADPLAARHTSAPDPSISHAAEISDQIDGKAVIIQQWLKQN